LGETDPCGNMERAHPGLRAALTPNWRGGIYGEVLEGGTLSVGDAVSFVRSD
jgi:MOSC domain-containing protein YiiM